MNGYDAASKDAAKTAAADGTTKPSKSSWTDGLVDVSDLSALDGEGCIFVVGAAAVAFLLAAVLGGLAIVGVWLRGLWRAVQRLGEPVRDLGPAAWLRQAQATPLWEQWVPTNDLAIRLVRALGRTLQLRPADERIAGRVLGRAKAQGGRVAALEIALDNALDLGEAMSVATRLISRLGGDIEVSELGDLDFVLPPEALRSAGALPDAPELEYLHEGGGDGAQTRRLAVNLPGLTRDHVLGATRLAGGPLATMVAMVVVILGDHGDLPIRGLDLSLGALFCLLPPGTLILAAATRQAVAESAAQGLLRDVRRLTMHRVRKAPASADASINSEAIAAELWPEIAATKVGWTTLDLGREVDAALADLGLEPEFTGRSGRAHWPLRQWRQRVDSLQQLREGAATSETAADAEDVVFDSGEVG